MHCQNHGTWNCMSTSCLSFYRSRGHTFPTRGLEVGYDTATGGLGVFEDLGGGIGVDLTTGDLAVDIGGMIVDL